MPSPLDFLMLFPALRDFNYTFLDVFYAHSLYCTLIALLECQIYVNKDVLLFNDEPNISRTKYTWNSVGLNTVTKEQFCVQISSLKGTCDVINGHVALYVHKNHILDPFML